MRPIIRSFVTAAALLGLLFAFSTDAHASGEVWVRGKALTFNDFKTSGTTKTVAVFTIPGKAADHYYIREVVLERVTDFAGGSISAATVQVGKSGATAKYVAATTDVFTGAKATSKYTIGSNTTSVNHGNIEAGGTVINVLMTSTSANLSALTAGAVTVHVLLAPLPAANTL